MTWARLDDRLSSSPEWVGMTTAALTIVGVEHYGAPPHELAEQARQLARLAKNVHLISLMWSVPALSDGRIAPAAVEQICAIGSFTPAEFHAGAAVLVKSGAWRAIKPSKADPIGAYQMVLSWSPGEQPTREEDDARRRRARLRDALREGGKDYPNKVRALERADGRCEYCDAVLDTGAQVDHVDPSLFSNDVENLAIACPSCNKKKGAHHRPEDVGMSFTQRAAARRHAWTTRGPRVVPPVGTVSARVGSGRVGSGRAGKGSGARQPKPKGTL